MRPNRALLGAIAAIVVCFLAALAVNVFYNEAHEVRGLNRTTFQAVVIALLALALAGCGAATWAFDAGRDEVQRAAERVSVYWGWMAGGFLWCLTPWLTSLPDRLVGPLSNPDGDTLFALSEATGAYMGGGVVLIAMVSACSAIIQTGWWLARR